MSVTLDVDDEPIPGLDADGRPDPAYAAALGLVPAPAGRRSAAFALDAAVWVVLALPGVIGAAMLAGRRRGRGRRGRRRGLGRRRVPPRAHRRQPGAPGGVRPHPAGAARPHGPHARQGGVRHPLGRRRRVRPGRLLAGHAARARAVGGAGAPPVRRPGGAVRVVRLGSRAARAQLARPDRRMLRARRAGRPRPVRRTGAPARAPGGSAPAGRRSSCAAVARQRPCTGRAHLHPVGEVEFRRGRVRARGVAAARARRARAAGAPASAPAASRPPASTPDPSSPSAAGAFVLRFDDGTAVAASPRGLLGRAPADVAGRTPAEVAGRTPAVLVPLSRRQHAHLEDARRVRRRPTAGSGSPIAPRRTAPSWNCPAAPSDRSARASASTFPSAAPCRLGGRRFTVERRTKGMKLKLGLRRARRRHRSTSSITADATATVEDVARAIADNDPAASAAARVDGRRSRSRSRRPPRTSRSCCPPTLLIGDAPIGSGFNAAVVADTRPRTLVGRDGARRGARGAHRAPTRGDACALRRGHSDRRARRAGRRRRARRPARVQAARARRGRRRRHRARRPQLGERAPRRRRAGAARARGARPGRS